MIILALFAALAASAPLPSGPPRLSRSAVEASPLTARPAGFEEIGVSRPDRGDSDVALVVASGIETALAPELAQLASDMESEGFDVSTHVMTGGSAADLRSWLAAQPGLGGAVLIGHLPEAWYESDWGSAHEEFPLDLYLMDLDGTWTDADGDGIFDGHSGDRAPEIWVGRIDAHAMEMGSQVDQLRDYLTANHLYRTGALALPARALVFNDDDWSYSGNCGLDAVYDDLDLYQSPSQTTDDYYRDRLAHGYEFVHLMAHSSPWGHTFKLPGGYAGTVMAPEVSQINPQTAFVQLFACSNCRWTEPDCLGNWYLFGTDSGLLAVGSTKTGAMLDFEEFYGPIGAGSIPGAAFRQWFTDVGIYDENWHYGCVLLGDPTLMPLSGRRLRSEAIPHSGGSREYTVVSESSESDCHPAAATAGDITCVAWLTGENGRLDLQARCWDGDSWSQVYTIDADEYWDVTPDVAFDGDGSPWVAWGDFDYASYGYNIKVAKGEGFGDVTIATSASGYDLDPALAWSGGMWMAWQVWRRGEGDIMIRRLDGGFPETYLSAQGSQDLSPDIAALDGEVFVVWASQGPDGGSILCSRGDETGFSPPVTLSSGQLCRAPTVCSAAGRVAVAWQESGSSSSVVARVWDGSSWSGEEVLTQLEEDAAMKPRAGTGPLGTPAVAWQMGFGEDATLRMCNFDPPVWSDPYQPVTPQGPAWLPAPADSGLAWAGTGGSGDWDVWFSPWVISGTAGGSGGGGTLRPRLVSNPARGSLLLRAAPSPGSVAEVGVYDLSGRLVGSGSWEMDGAVHSMDMSGRPVGVYAVRVVLGTESWTGRFTLLR
jgi:hypothetical protein